MSKDIFLPPQVIKRLFKYSQEGCDLSIILEELEGKAIRRYIANNTVIWSEELK